MRDDRMRITDWSNITKGIAIVQATLQDIPGILAVEESAWGENAATLAMFKKRITIFPEGVLAAKRIDDGRIVGATCLCIRHYSEEMIFNESIPALDWFEATGNGMIESVHDMAGNTVYGVSLSVHGDYLSRGLGRTLLMAGSEHVSIRFNKKLTLVGARIPGFADYSGDMSPQEYVSATDGNGKLLDGELAFFLSTGYAGNRLEFARIIDNYFTDPLSKDFAALLVWQNPFFEE